MSKVTLEEIVSLCKRRGFIFPGSEIYGGLSGTWDYGPLGVSLKKNIQNLWWNYFVKQRRNVYGLDSAILMNQKVWQASGHVDTFNDPLIEDKVTKKRYRLDHLIEDNGLVAEGLSLSQMNDLVNEKGIKSPDGNELGKADQFNLMFQTMVGPVASEESKVYLRPETAQGMFVNFKNIVDTFYPDLPFGIAQIGKNFRNEISPRDFIFRSREMEIMEYELFIDPENWEKEFDIQLNMVRHFFVEVLGLDKDKLHEKEIPENERAHYSKRTIDFEYEFPIGVKEIAGLAYRTDYDLTKHQEKSGKNLEYTVKGDTRKFIPHVIEPSFGLDRLVLAVLSTTYKVDEVNGEPRTYLDLPNKLAPYKAMVSPLLKNKPELVKKADEIFNNLMDKFGDISWDDNGNIGKRYRRQDEIGTPYCITVD
ncbi:glycine--tRNA ligase, partial [bacterium]|nr:glycine--tRNA ligase [bacterium]